MLISVLAIGCFFLLIIFCGPLSCVVPTVLYFLDEGGSDTIGTLEEGYIPVHFYMSFQMVLHVTIK